MRIFGHPNLVMMSSNMNFTKIPIVQSLTARASIHLVKYSMVVMMYLAPVHFPSGFTGPKKSMAHFSKACNHLSKIFNYHVSKELKVERGNRFQ